MKKPTYLLYTLLFPLALLSGACNTLHTLRPDRLDQQALQTESEYWISGVNLDNGAYIRLRKETYDLRGRFDLPDNYVGPVLVGDTLYGYLLSKAPVPIPVRRIDTYRVRKFDAITTFVVLPVGLAAVVGIPLLLMSGGLSGFSGF